MAPDYNQAIVLEMLETAVAEVAREKGVRVPRHRETVHEIGWILHGAVVHLAIRRHLYRCKPKGGRGQGAAPARALVHRGVRGRGESARGAVAATSRSRRDLRKSSVADFAVRLKSLSSVKCTRSARTGGLPARKQRGEYQWLDGATLTRRSFLKNSASGIAAASIIGKASQRARSRPGLFRDLVRRGRYREEPHRCVRSQDRPQGRILQLAVGAIPRNDGHQVRRQGADRHALGLRQLAARMGRGRLDLPIDQYKSLTGYNSDRRPVLRRLDDPQGQAVRHHLLHRLHGLHLQRRDSRQGRHQGAAADLERGRRAIEDHQGQGPVAVADAARARAGDLADRVPCRDDLLAGRPLHRRQGQRDDAGRQERCRHCAALGRRRGAEAQDPLALVRRDRRARGAEELLVRPARLRADAEVPAAHAQRPEAEPDRRQDQDRPDAEGRERLARHGRLDALLRHDAARAGERRRAPPTP